LHSADPTRRKLRGPLARQVESALFSLLLDEKPSTGVLPEMPPPEADWIDYQEFYHLEARPGDWMPDRSGDA